MSMSNFSDPGAKVLDHRQDGQGEGAGAKFGLTTRLGVSTCCAQRRQGHRLSRPPPPRSGGHPALLGAPYHSQSYWIGPACIMYHEHYENYPEYSPGFAGKPLLSSAKSLSILCTKSLACITFVAAVLLHVLLLVCNECPSLPGVNQALDMQYHRPQHAHTMRQVKSKCLSG